MINSKFIFLFLLFLCGVCRASENVDSFAQKIITTLKTQDKVRFSSFQHPKCPAMPEPRIEAYFREAYENVEYTVNPVNKHFDLNVISFVVAPKKTLVLTGKFKRGKAFSFIIPITYDEKKWHLVNWPCNKIKKEKDSSTLKTKPSFIGSQFNVTDVGKTLLWDGHEITFKKIEGDRIYLVSRPRHKALDLVGHDTKNERVKVLAIGQNLCCEEESNHNFLFKLKPKTFKLLKKTR